ncbi:hypothetical protein AVEN_83995-1 [Araneus ventricosus]|uniref:Uncharacterized protein n=1 Tax=Araneus ventricosus TaxID=182803 RepID=A0A4Y2BR74_ARAVE|nr:hypothetical protein AVEN_83995-1 [Araneus ventricosus]
MNPPVPSGVVSSDTVVIAFVFELYERRFDLRLGGISIFVTICNEIVQITPSSNKMTSKEEGCKSNYTLLRTCNDIIERRARGAGSLWVVTENNPCLVSSQHESKGLLAIHSKVEPVGMHGECSRAAAVVGGRDTKWKLLFY